MKISVQAYTIRDKAKEDMKGALRAIAESGYEGVELAGFNGLTAEELKCELDKNNLTPSGAHVTIDALENDFDGWMSNLELLGMDAVTIPWLPSELFSDKDKVTEIIGRLNALAEKMKPHGIELSFHNHGIEISSGAMERMANECPGLMLEVDTYWVKFAGVDPLEFLEKLKSRVSLIHIKDMLDKPDLAHNDPNPNILEGCMDIAAVMKKAGEIGVRWAVVEMDIPIGDSVEAICRSRENLKAIGY